MTERGLETLLASLGAGFDAALDRAESVAASDLAFSLAQGWSLRASVGGRRPVAASVFGRLRAVAIVGPDYVVGPDWVARLAGSILVAHDGPVPEASELPLRARLGRWARRAAAVEIETMWGLTTAGTMIAVGSDHVVVDSSAGPAYVPVDALRSLRIARGG